MTCAPRLQLSGVAVREMTEAPCAGPESPRMENSRWELDRLSGERARPSRGLPARCRLPLVPRGDQRLPADDREPQDRNLRRVEMSEEKRHLRSKLFID